MALSRIWTAFIIIALLVAAGKFVFEPGQQHIFSSLVTGKNTDTIGARTLDSEGIPASVHSQLVDQKVAIWGKEKVYKTGDHNYRAFKLLPANGIFETTKDAVNLCIGLIGIMALFMGFMSIAERAGGIRFLSRIIGPFFSRIFPEVPKGHPSMGHMVMNFSANLMGLDNAATPFGIKAMESLQEINPDKTTASNSQLMFLCLHASGLTLIPTIIIADRVALKSQHPTDGLSTSDPNLPQNFWGGSFATTAAPGSDDACRYIFQNGVQFPVITAAEIAFTKAEALWLTGDKPGALTAYINGLNLSFDFLTGTPEFHNKVPAAMQITPATKAAYLANPAVVPTAANLTLSHIMMQKYIALYGYGFMQTWVDMRRYHYTDLDPVTGMQVYADFTAPSGGDLYPDNNGKLAYRARPRYNSEYLYNVVALTSIGAIALDYHTKEQWFSQP